MTKDLLDHVPPSRRTPSSVTNALKPAWRKTETAERQEFFLPVSGFVWFFPEEISIIDHISFQRLSKINQLGQSFYVYRGATHKRIEHVLGVVGVIDEMIAAVNHNAHKGQLINDTSFAPRLSDMECRFLRLGALLHDIGHIAAGHTIEDELELLGKHDGDERISKVLDKTVWSGIKVDSLRSVIDHEYANYVPPNLKGKISPSEIIRHLIRKVPKEKSKDSFYDQRTLMERSSEIRYDICRNMIGNTICADILDYIYRDWYHIGKIRTGDGRIYQYMELRRQKNGLKIYGKQEEHDFQSADDRFVIALGEKAKVRTDGISAILALLEWRYELAEAVLFHRAKVAASAMLERALTSLWGNVDEVEILEKVIMASDDELLDLATDELVNQSLTERQIIAQEILTHLKERNIYACLSTFDSTNTSDDVLAKLNEWFAVRNGTRGASAKNRIYLAESIEQAYDLKPGSIVIYHVNVRAKIAEVVISIDDRIIKLNEYENANDELGKDRKGLSGGHLSAQVKRFDKLCKTYVFIERGEKLRAQSAGILASIESYIKSVTFATGDIPTINRAVRMHARDLRDQYIAQKRNDMEYFDYHPVVAKSDDDVVSTKKLLNGADDLTNYFLKHVG